MFNEVEMIDEKNGIEIVYRKTDEKILSVKLYNEFLMDYYSISIKDLTEKDLNRLQKLVMDDHLKRTEEYRQYRMYVMNSL